jgi:hypothetical protein
LSLRAGMWLRPFQESVRQVPPDFVPPIATPVGCVRTVIAHPCRTSFEFLADGELSGTWFASLAKEQVSAEQFAEGMRGQTVPLKYDPRKAKAPVVGEGNPRGTRSLKIHESQTLLASSGRAEFRAPWEGTGAVQGA